MLKHLNVNHKIHSTPADGDCFFHSLSHQINNLISANTLRKIAAQSLNQSDVILFNAINRSNFNLTKLRKLISTQKIWADSIEINAISRNMPKLCFLIIDDSYMTITKIEQTNEKNKKYIFIRRKNYHYESIEFFNNDHIKILNIMKFKDNYSISKNYNNELLIQLIAIIIPIFILLKFFNSSLKNW